MSKFLTVVFALLLASCSDTIDRLKQVGKSPKLANVELPAHQDQEPIDYLQIEKQRTYVRKTNSLWQPGTTNFFKDSRAWRIGDILKVKVKIQDSASLNNSTKRNRSGKDTTSLIRFFGKERAIAATLSKSAKAVGLNPALNVSSAGNHTGSGNISRQESISTAIAAMVTKVLPNGNLVIQGHQEVKVNYELREIKIAGIIRPKDIDTENAINLNQIAEARISYSGRGTVSDVQQPRLGSQVIDILSPF